MGLNCVGPLLHGFFPIRTTLLQLPRFAESSDAEPGIWRNQGYSMQTMGLDNLQILLSVAGPGTNPLQIPRADCMFCSILAR